MAKLWIRVIKAHRMVQSVTVPCTLETCEQALYDTLPSLDIARPLWLDKHEREFCAHRRTSFTPDHFLEDVPFDKLEIEFIDDEKKKSPRS